MPACRAPAPIRNASCGARRRCRRSRAARCRRRWRTTTSTQVVAGFAAATRLAMDAGCAGVEINAGQHSLVRQFLSGLTNLRGDEYGSDKVRFAREVLAAVRDADHDRQRDRRAPPVLRRARPLGRAHPGVRHRRRRRARRCRPGRLRGRRPRLDLLGRRHPSRRPYAAGVQHRSRPHRARRDQRPGRAAGFRRRSRRRRSGAHRRAPPTSSR